MLAKVLVDDTNLLGRIGGDRYAKYVVDFDAGAIVVVRLWMAMAGRCLC